METFVKVINDVRDILRKDGITGMDSINHCLCFITNRSLTTEKCQKLDILPECAYENIMRGEDGREVKTNLLWDRFCNLSKPDSYIIQMYKVLHLKNWYDFKIKLPETLLQIMRLLGKVDIEGLSTEYDIVGMIYEIHLRSGTTSARDLGQYFTDRRVIKYMIDLCKPKIENGEIETICDPTCGTAGFLCMSIRYLNDLSADSEADEIEKIIELMDVDDDVDNDNMNIERAKTANASIDWAKNKSRIYGCDIDDNVANIAKLNLFLETGELFDIRSANSLYEDIVSDSEKVDVILANEPFGVKHLIHANCCDKVKKLKIFGTRSEPLFLQLIMQSLSKKGRCAVIVPDGVLFSASSMHRETRKHLLRNFNVQKIISLDGDYFMNTGIKASIIFFSRGMTHEVEFSKIQLIKNRIVETCVTKACLESIQKNAYSLFVNSYSITKQIKIEGVIYKKLGNLLEPLPSSKRPASFGKNVGKYPFFSSSAKVLKCDVKDYDDDCIVIGMGGSACIYKSKGFSCSNHTLVCKSKSPNLLGYIYCYLKYHINLLQNGFKGATIKNLSKDYALNVEIPVPNVDFQKQIVSKLNFISESIKSNERRICEIQRENKLFVECYAFGAEFKKLGDLLEMLPKSKKWASFGKNEGTYPFFSSSIRVLRCEEKDYVDECIIVGTGGRATVHIAKEFSCSGDTFVFKSKTENLLSYIYYYLVGHMNLLQNGFRGSTIKHITRDYVLNIDVELPKLETQRIVVQLCEENDKNIANAKQSICKLIACTEMIFSNYLRETQ